MIQTQMNVNYQLHQKNWISLYSFLVLNKFGHFFMDLIFKFLHVLIYPVGRAVLSRLQGAL